MVSKYLDVKEGEWVYPKRKGYKVACCDCGLVHVFNFKLIGGKRKKILIQAFRNNRSTASIRRYIKK